MTRRVAFHLTDSPLPSVRPGVYHMISKVRENFPGEFLYRLGHPLGEHVIQVGKSYPTPVGEGELRHIQPSGQDHDGRGAQGQVRLAHPATARHRLLRT